MFYLNHLGLVCSLGRASAQVKHSMLDLPYSGIRISTDYCDGFPLPLGKVVSDLPVCDFLSLRDNSRNNRLLFAALEQIRPAVDNAIEAFGAHRVGIIIGTSTSGIAESEAAFRHRVQQGEFPEQFHYCQQELASPAAALASVLGICGPAYVHSNACASSAKAMAGAARLIHMGICDAVLTGGVDSLSSFVLSGFMALESISTERCNPMSVNRCGINIGEGAALFLMSRKPATVALRGWGESSDGYHISAPSPDGSGATLSIQKALQRAGITSGEIDYINMHGTATLQNDAMESKAIYALFGDTVAVSSTKPMTGHTLGAAGAIEAALCWLAMQDDNPSGKVPEHLWDGQADPELPLLNLVASGFGTGYPLRWCLSNSFAFGGSNVTLIFGRE
ncbi:MAG: beta-ketoacyl-ACP synthase [Betaproteobacteria bacterium]|nr:beta-ketoacyl-ACP synthase [Betaproteobacteria bacterium]